MQSKLDAAQWKHEAEYHHEASKIEGENEIIGYTPPKNERIELQQRDNYRPPDFLNQTATQTEYAELNEILEELWKLNNDYAGERTLEVEAYLAATGENEVLSEMARIWCHNYFGHRCRKYNGRDNGDPVKMFVRLAGEFETLLGNHEKLEKSLNYVILGNCLPFIRWLLGKEALESLAKDNSETATSNYRKLHDLLAQYYVVQDYLTPFIKVIHHCADPSRLNNISNASDLRLKEILQQLADDAQQMRPFLVKGFDVSNTVAELGGGLFVAWDWTTNGMAQILSGPDKKRMIGYYTASHKVYLPIKIRYDGLLSDGPKPWIHTATMPSIPGINALAVNVYLFELLHEKLFSCYDKIDFDRIRQRAKKATDEEIEQDDVILAESCQQVAIKECEDEKVASTEDAPPQRTGRIRPLRMEPLLRFLAKRFCCEVRPGKGSEITVFRIGGKKAILGHHERNGVVYPVTLKRLLARLGISLAEWSAAAFE